MKNRTSLIAISVLILGVIFLFCSICISQDAYAEGEVRSLKDFQYWDNGTVKQCTVYDAHTGRLKTRAFCAYGGSVEKVEKFDEAGNKIEEALYDANGALKAGIDGWAAMRWRYDGLQIVWQVSYDENGKSIEQKFYTSSGNLAMRLYRDDDSVNPYANAAMYMMLGGRNIGYYDSRGTLDEIKEDIKEK